MPFTNTAKDSMLDSLTTFYASAHTEAPGQTGINEVSGGAPAYARQSMTFGAASNGVKSATSQPVLDIPGGTTVKYVGVWDAPTAGNFLGYKVITDEVYGNQGTLTVTSFDLNINDV